MKEGGVVSLAGDAAAGESSLSEGGVEGVHGGDEMSDKVLVGSRHDLVANDGDVRFGEEREQVKTLHVLCTYFARS